MIRLNFNPFHRGPLSSAYERGFPMVLKGIGILSLWILFGYGQEVFAENLEANRWQDRDLRRVKISQLILDPSSQQPVVLLTDLLEEKALPIWIGPCEADALYATMEKIKRNRPFTHDLMETIIQKMKGKIQRIIITHSKDGIYYATMTLERDGTMVEIDARPSDSIIIALKLAAPIFVVKGLFDEAAIAYKIPKDIEDRYGLTLQALTPDLAQSFSFPSTQGVLISEVSPGSFAEKDGLQRGDIIVGVEEKKISNLESLREVFTKSKGPLKINIYRKGKSLSLKLNSLAGSLSK
jgi:uncharacterized protein